MHIEQHNRLAVRALAIFVLVLLALSTLSAAAWAAGGITLTKTDTLIDGDDDGLADPGETIRYTLILQNTNAADATNVQFTDVLDANTSLVAGTLNISPLAVDDAYETVGNTLLEVGVTAGGSTAVRVTGSVLDNDREFLGDTFSITAYDAASANSGTVSLNADGTFTYLPEAGFSGNDTFTYTLTDGAGLTGVGVVTVRVLTPVWYVDDSAAAGGSGRSTAPFQTLPQAGSASAAGEVIYLFSGSYTNGLTLKDNQTLTGEGVALTVAGYTLRPAGVRPEVAANTTLITLASGNTVQGLNLTTSAGSAISASSAAGTTTITQVNTTLSGSAAGLSLTNQGGSFNYTNSSIQGTTTGRGVWVSGGNAAFSFQTTPVNITNGGGISFSGKNGGAVSFDANSPVTVNGTNVAAVYLNSNPTSSFAFNAGMTLVTTSANALDVYNSGTLAILGSNNTIATTTGVAVTIQGTTIDANGATFRSVSANGSANGILLSGTGAQGIFQVTGTGTTNGSGGTIQNTSLNGVYLANAQRVYLSNLSLNNAGQSAATCTYNDNSGCIAAVKMSSVSDVRLENVDITGATQTGINGADVAGFIYRNSALTAATDSVDEDSIDLRQLTGAVEISNNQIANGYDRGLLVRNTSGSATLTITGNAFSANTGNDAVAIDLVAGGTASADVTFSNNTVQNVFGAGFRLNNEGSGTARTWVNNNTISGSGAGVDLTAFGTGALNFNVSNNPQIQADWVGINIENKGPSATMQGRVLQNANVSAADVASSAIWVRAQDGGQIIAEVSSNAVTNFGYRGIEVESLGVGSRADVTLASNSVAQPSAGTPVAGVSLRSGNNVAGESSILCVNANGNTLNLNPTIPDLDLRWYTQATTRFYVQGLSSFTVSAPTANPVGDYLASTNTLTEYYVSTGTYASSVCLTPSFVAEPPDGPALAQAGAQPRASLPAGTAGAATGAPAATTSPTNAPAAVAVQPSPKTGLASLLPAWLLRPLGAGETISEDLGALPAGKTLTVTFDVTVNSSISGGVKAISNQAQVTADGLPATLSDDPDTLILDDPTLTTHGATPDLAVTKDDNPDTATAGETLAYAIAYANNGAQAALGVVITETLPTGTTFNAAASAPGWSCDAGVCTYPLSSLAAGSSGTVTLTVNVDGQFAAGVSSLHNAVSIADDGSGGADPDLSDNAATLDTPLAAQPELSLTKSDQDASFMPGDAITYTLSYQNSGSQVATNVELVETVPAYTTFDAANSSAGWVCASGGGAGDACTLALGNLSTGASGERTFTVTVADPADGVAQISNTASIRDDGANGAELNTANNQATDTTPVRNRAPTLSDVSITPTVDENGSVTLSGSISDPEGDALTLLVDWGDGQSDTYHYAASATTFSETHSYRDDAPSGTASDVMTVDLTLQDGSGAQDSDQVTTTVANVAPVLSQLGLNVGTVAENGAVTLSGDIADASALDNFTLQVDWGDGTDDSYTYPAGTTSFSETHTYRDDPAAPASAYTIQATLSDDDTGSDADSLSITVTNVAPAFGTISVADVDEGAAATLSGLFTDPGALDTFTLLVDWGDGSAVEQADLAAGASSFNLTHTYVDDDPTGTSADDYTISLTISDDDGGSDADTRTLSARNVAPTIANFVAAGAAEGSPASVSGDIVDPGVADSFTLTVDWGDGSTAQQVDLAAGASSFGLTHAYADDDPTGTPADDYNVAVTLEDDDGGSDAETSAVTITNAAPVALAGSDFSTTIDQTFTLSGSFTDAGSPDTHTYTWDMGNGDILSGSLTPTYAYGAAGVYTATLTVEDDDGGQGSDTVEITVTPSADLALTKTASSASAMLGTEITFTLTVANLGPSGATGVTLVDELPAGLRFISAPAGCTEDRQVITCSLGSLANGGSASVEIVARVSLTSPGVLLNTASVSANEGDANLTNNTASAQVQAGNVVTISDSDFEDEIPAAWQGCANSLSQTPRGERGFLGEFGNETACLTLSDLPPHTRVMVTFDLFILRSWDGNVVSNSNSPSAAAIPDYQMLGVIGPDRWQLRGDGAMLIDTTFTNWWAVSTATQAYPGSYPDGNYPPRTGALETGSLGYNFNTVTDQDAVYRISRGFEHTSDSLLLEFSAFGLQRLADESWGLDNVKVILMDMTDWKKIYLPVMMR